MVDHADRGDGRHNPWRPSSSPARFPRLVRLVARHHRRYGDQLNRRARTVESGGRQRSSVFACPTPEIVPMARVHCDSVLAPKGQISVPLVHCGSCIVPVVTTAVQTGYEPWLARNWSHTYGAAHIDGLRVLFDTLLHALTTPDDGV
ncbi:hypothetical protein QLQ12_37445 [Actinoplanes sp. NEAU-A12]|uniref:Uncharacterized protein n=1 Tax=Actinoplanes sandaracinus TaxID=3045177 RepID=A0ABT6WX24_9ACTN|nr:hypothetical protein [Actinoplanes sandaracinus]MDI6104293.1 hypothetical protein [Actinoplanes sandaracinus]